jgi:hypothetical protein
MRRPQSMAPRRPQFGARKRKQQPRPRPPLATVYERTEFYKRVANHILDVFDESLVTYGEMSCEGLWRRLASHADTNKGTRSLPTTISDGIFLADVALAYNAALPERRKTQHDREDLKDFEVIRLGRIFLNRGIYPLSKYFGSSRPVPVPYEGRTHSQMIGSADDEPQHADYSEMDGFDVEVTRPALPAWAQDDSGLGLD